MRRIGASSGPSLFLSSGRRPPLNTPSARSGIQTLGEAARRFVDEDIHDEAIKDALDNQDRFTVRRQAFSRADPAFTVLKCSWIPKPVELRSFQSF